MSVSFTGLPSAAEYGQTYTITVNFTYVWTTDNDKPNGGATVRFHELDATNDDEYGTRTVATPANGNNSTGTWSGSATFSNVDLAGIGGADEVDDILDLKVSIEVESPFFNDIWATGDTANLRNAQPAFPTSISVPTSDSDGSYTISWGASQGHDSYELQEKRDSGSWSTVYTGGSTSWTTPSSRTGGSTYYYQVRALNSSSQSSYRSGANGIVVSQPNRAPTSPGQPTATLVTASSAAVNWGASTDPDGDTITYEVYYARAYTSDPWTSAGTTTSTSRAISGLSANQNYSLRVVARDGRGLEASNVNTAAFTTLPSNRAPSSPGQPTASSSSITTSGATVNWGASSDPDGDTITYEVYYARAYTLDPWTAAGTTTSTSRTISGLSANQNYSLRVVARDGRGLEAENVNTAAFTTLPSNRAPSSPGQPSVSSSSITTSGATVNWGASSDPDGDTITYEVYYARAYTLDSWTAAGTTTSTSRSISGLSGNQSYSLRVVARDGRGLEAENVNTAAFTTLPLPAVLVVPVSSFSKNANEGQNANSDTFTVSNTGGSALTYSITDSATWLSVSPTSGTVGAGGSTTLTVSYSTSGLVVGNHSATITVTASGATGSPKTINVSLTVVGPVESGRFVSVTPSTFTGGQATTVTVRVQNTGEADDMIIELGSAPSGWTVSPSSLNPYMASGAYYDAQFTVTPPVNGGAGVIEWRFLDDDFFSGGNQLLASTNHSVVASKLDPYDIAVLEPSGVNLFSAIPASGRTNMTDLNALKNSGLKSGSRLLDGSDQKLVIVIHGWNPNDNPDQTLQEITGALNSAVSQDTINRDWRVIAYDWSRDAFTGGISGLARESRPLSSAPSGNRVLAAKEPALFGEANATKSAEHAYQHGLLIGAKLLAQVGPANLKSVHLIGHSAGSWAVYGALRYLAANAPTTLQLQTTFLDPFVPADVISGGNPAFSRALQEAAPNYCRVVNGAADLAEHYWAEDYLATGTETPYIFTRQPSTVFRTDGSEYGDANWDGHGGPILFYRDTVNNLSHPHAGGHGWRHSLAFNEPTTVTVARASGQGDPALTSPMNFVVTFSRRVTGFTTGDVLLSGTAGASVATVSGSGTTYNVAVSGITQNGAVTMTIPAGVALDDAGNGNGVSAATTVTYAGQSLAIVPSISAFDVAEGGTASITVRLSAAPAANVTVSVGRIGGDGDISVDSGASLVFTPSDWNVGKVVRFRAVEDGDTLNGSATFQFSAAGLQNVEVTIGEIDNYSPPSRVITLNGDLGFGSVPVNTASQRGFTISNSGNTPLTVSGIAYPSGFSGNWSSGTIAAGSSQPVTVTFSPSSEGSYSGTISVTSDATSGSGSLAVSGVASVLPPAGTLQFSASTASVAENAGSVALTVTRTGGSSGAVGVNYASANGTATAGSDYTAVNSTLSWADGDTANKLITVTLLDDATAESSETFTVNFSSPTGGATLGMPSTATVTITDDDPLPPGTLQFSSPTANVSENARSVVMIVTRTVGSSGAVGVSYASANGTATAGSDYTAVSSSLNWADGDTAIKVITVPILSDTAPEGDETFTVILSAPSGGANLGALTVATVTIIDGAFVGPVLSPANGHYYEFVTNQLAWAEARASAEMRLLTNGWRGHLATVSDQAENDFITGLVTGGTAWLGAFRASNSTGSWQWITGESFTFTAWRSGEPNNSNNNEDSIHTHGLAAQVGYRGYWNDGNGATSPMGYVVEYEPMASTSLVIASGLNGPGSIVLDGSDIYFTDNTAADGIVKRVSKGGGTVSTVVSGAVANDSGSLRGVARFVVVDGTIYGEYGGYDSHAVFRVSTGGGSLTTLTTENGGAFIGVSGANIYYSSGFANLRSMSTNGGGANQLLGGYWVRGSAIDSTNVYFTDYGTRSVFSYNLASGTVTTLIAGSFSEGGIFIDDNSVFFNVDGSIKRVAKAGGAVTTLVNSGTAYGHVSDGTHLYFTDGGMIQMLPLVGGTATMITNEPAGGTGIAVDGTHLYYADRSGGTGAGSIIKIPKMGLPNQPPTVSLTASPVTVNAGTSVVLNATAADTDGTVVKVEFIDGATKLGEALAMPFSLTVSTFTAGSHTLTAKATDDKGAVTTSAAIIVTINRLAQTITFPTIPAKTLGDAPFALGATSSSGRPVYYINEDPSVASIQFGTGLVTLLRAGTTVITAQHDGDETYLPSDVVSRTLTVAATPNQPPTVALNASPSTVNQGQTVTLTATAADTDGTVVKVEFFNGATKLGEDLTAPYTLDVTTLAAGSHSLTAKATDNVGAVTTSTTVAVTVNGGGPFAVRQLPAGYSPGSKFTVTITATPAANAGVYAVEDVPPVGWTVGTISNSGSFDAPNGKVKFGPFFDATARTLTYEVTPPANATGILTFVGTASADGVNSPVGGAATIDRALRHPADNSTADDRISIGEVTAYGAAWKTGATWPLDPNPIPIGYVTRAGALWKGGETYRFDASVASAPLWWVNTGLVPAGLRPLSVGPAALGEASADLAGGFQRNKDFVVSLRARPNAGVQAYAVEETVPPGWTVKAGSLDQGGAYDGNSRKVKWGPFFDTVERTFTFVLEPGANSDPVVFVGVASFDGVDVPFRGRRAIQRGAFLPENANVGRDVKRDGYRVVVMGEAGKRYDIEATETPGVPNSWVPVATNLDGAALVDFTDTLATSRQARFYRVIER